MEWPAPAGPDRIRRIKMWTPDELGGQHIVVVPPWGYLEGFEVRMRELVPLRGHLELVARRPE